jgi:hypothetical protein
VAHACNPSYLGTEIKRIVVQRTARANICETPFQQEKKSSVVAHSCHPASAGSINRRITVQAVLSKKARPHLPNN